MLFGTINSTLNQLKLASKWEAKKKSGDVTSKDKENMTEDELTIHRFNEQLKQERENSEYSKIHYKILNGEELSDEELKKLKMKDPQAYRDYISDRAEEKSYEKKLQNCKTKEEAKKLHSNKINGELSKFRSIVNDPIIPKSVKYALACRITGKTKRMAKIFEKFAETTEYEKLPETEQQRNELKKAEEHGKEKVEEVAKDISTDINNAENAEETTEKNTEGTTGGTTDIVIEMPDKKESHDGEISDTAVNEMTSTTEKIGKSIYHRRKLNVKA